MKNYKDMSENLRLMYYHLGWTKAEMLLWGDVEGVSSMMIFIGDFVNLGSSDNWLEVTAILGPMHIRLSNGQTVEASEKHITDYRSAGEMARVA